MNREKEEEIFRRVNSGHVKVIERYCHNNMELLKAIIDPIMIKLGRNSTSMDYDDFLSVANYELTKIVVSFDSNKNDSIDEYIKVKLPLKIKTHLTYQNRDKRKNYRKDSDGKKIELKPVYMDAQVNENGEKRDLYEVVSSSSTYEAEFEDGFNSEKVEEYLNSLSNIQRKIVKMLAIGYEKKEIQNVLSITKRVFEENIKIIKCYENVRILQKYEEEE